jgi:hypothetical protein
MVSWLNCVPAHDRIRHAGMLGGEAWVTLPQTATRPAGARCFLCDPSAD